MAEKSSTKGFCVVLEQGRELNGGLCTVGGIPKQPWLSGRTVAVSRYPGVIGTDSRGRLVLVHSQPS